MGFGGDEYVILLSEYDEPKGADLYARKLLHTLTRPCRVAGREVTLGASIGCAEFLELTLDAGLLLQRAAVAMY